MMVMKFEDGKVRSEDMSGSGERKWKSGKIGEL